MGRRPYALVAALLALVVLVGCDHPSQPHRASPAPVGSASPARPAATGLTGRITYNTEDGDLWVMNADGSGRRQVTHSGDGNDFDPSWSPDGRRIVFRTSRGAHLPDTASIGLDGIFVVNADGSGERPIHPPTGGLFPDWSPDGRWIAFSGVQPPSDRPDYLYVMRPDGTGVRPVSTANASECAEWSPDGSKIAFCGHWGSADSVSTWA
jgi:Tol biopolymer transport system component